MNRLNNENYDNGKNFSIDIIAHLEGKQPDQIGFADYDFQAVKIILQRIKNSKELTIKHFENCLKITHKLKR